MDFSTQIAQELNLSGFHVANVICLFDDGATIPFIARYRKEMTGSMNEEVITAIQKRLEQLTELQKRKESVISSIREQGKLTDELEQKILNATTLQEVEDLYLPTSRNVAPALPSHAKKASNLWLHKSWHKTSISSTKSHAAM